jgi:hypothetical protein
MTDSYANSLDPAEKKRQALLKEFGMTPDLEEAPDPAPGLRTLVVLGCLGLGGASLFLPALTYGAPGQLPVEMPTWEMIGGGWVSIHAANLALSALIIQVVMRQEVGATVAGVAGVALAGVTFLMDTVGVDKPGNRFPVLSFEIGFYLWQAAMLLGLLGSAWLWWLDRNADAAQAVEPQEW